jgi:hypothetical protein
MVGSLIIYMPSASRWEGESSEAKIGMQNAGWSVLPIFVSEATTPSRHRKGLSCHSI